MAANCARPVSAHAPRPPASQDLNQHQILPILLTGAPLASDVQQRQQAWHAPDERQLRWQAQRISRASQRTARDSRFSSWDSSNEDWGLPAQSPPRSPAHSPRGPARDGNAEAAGNGDTSTSAGKGGAQQRLEERLSPADYQRLLQGRGLDCRGWRLVVMGHSLGAAVAALVGMHLRDWCPGAAASSPCLLRRIRAALQRRHTTCRERPPTSDVPGCVCRHPGVCL